MTNQCTLKARTTSSSLHFIPLIASLALIPANGAKAQESGHTEPQVLAGQGDQPDQEPGFDPAPSEKQDDWKISVSAGVMYMPAFNGSKDYQAMAFPDIKLEYKDLFFASLFEGVGYNVVNNGKWRAGPIMKFDFGRQEKDDNPFRIAGKKTKALKGMGDVDATVELGGFAEYNFEPFSYSLELRQGVGGHKGFIGETGLSYAGFTEQLGQSIMYSVGPHATFADSKYNDAYFGINQVQSVNSGLPTYSTSFGLVSYGLEAFAMTRISDTLSLGVFASYDRLTGEAADSPLIKERGDENQFMSGVRLSYEFGF